MKKLNYVALYYIYYKIPNGDYDPEYVLTETMQELTDFLKSEQYIYGEEYIKVYKIFSLDKEYEFKNGEIKEL